MARQDESVLFKAGAYGKVSIAEYNGTECAAKESISYEDSSKGAHENVLITEYQRMLQVHPNSRIVQFTGFPAVPLLLVMKMVDCDLDTLLECYPDVLIDIKFSLLLGVSLGLKFLHSQKPSVVHCNLSSNNILLTPHLQAKISDTRVVALVPGKPVKESTKNTCFVAPNICKSNTDKPRPAGKIFDLSVEVFSYCVTTLHTATQQWPERQPIAIASSKVDQCNDKIVSGGVVGCLVDVPNKRPPNDEMLEKLENYAVTQKSVIACQTKVEQKSQLKNKKAEHSKQKEIQQIKYLNNLLYEHVHIQLQSLTDNTLKPGNLQAMVRDLDEQLELKFSENINLNKQINSLNRQLRIIKSTDAVKEVCTIADKKNDEELKSVTGQQENKLQEEKISVEKESSHSDQQLMHRDVKSTPKVSIKQNSQQAKVTSSKNEFGDQEKQKSSRIRRNSQQGKPKKKKKEKYKDQAADQNSTNDWLGKDDRKGNNTDLQPSNNDGQGGKKIERRNLNIRKKQSKKKQQGTSASQGTHYKFDQLGPKVIDQLGPKVIDQLGPKVIDQLGPKVIDQLGPKVIDKLGPKIIDQLDPKVIQLGPKVIGFHNEGNTCFFNAMLQCIHQTSDLHYAIAEGKRKYMIYTSKGPLAIEVANKPGPLTGDVRRLFYEISRQTGPYLSPYNLLQTIGRRNSRFGHGTQEDSHEVLRYLLSVLREEEIECIKQKVVSQHGVTEELLSDKSIDKETKDYVKECLSKVSKGVCDIDCIFGSYLISTTICHECEIPLQTTEFHFDISLPMPEDNSKAQNYCEVPIHPSKKGKGKQNKGQAHVLSSEQSSNIPEVVKSQQKFNLHLQERSFFHCSYSDAKDLKLETALEHCLLAFTSIDTLDEDNKFICQACSVGKPEVVLCRVSKQILIHKLPPVLIFHIKRFSIGSHRVRKDNRPLPFPFVLDMVPFCTTECIETFGDSDKKILYGLYAAVEHIGSLHGGHYATYVRRRPFQRAKDIHLPTRHSIQSTDVTLKKKYNEKTAEEGEWYYTNDSQVSKCNPEIVLNCRPYLLFYEMLPKM